MKKNIKFVEPDELQNVCEKITAITKLEKLNFSFENQREYHKILNNLNKIQFDNCYFQIQWLHNPNKGTQYLNCIFDKFEILNVSENKITAIGCLFYNCEFKNINCEGVVFEKILFKFNNLYKHKKIEEVKFVNCEFRENFLLNIAPSEDERFKITNLDLSESTFKKKVKIQFLNIEKASFYNTKFKDLVVLSLFIYQNPRLLLKIILIISALMFLFLSYISLDTVADKINPFSIMTSKDPIAFGLLMFKITIAYLIYQFIVSVRQNTRRK
ncbi:MAG: hypothetical protein WC390_02720 [Sulfurimonas sp.]|jgi:hypothetical protein